MGLMRRELRDSRAESLVVVTPHGAAYGGKITLAATDVGFGKLDKRSISVKIDIGLSRIWSEEAAERGVHMAPVAPKSTQAPFPLDWGVTIPLALLDPDITLPAVIACPGPGLEPEDLMAMGEALVAASDAAGLRVALIASADQGHGHADDGPYGFASQSGEYDLAMRNAVESDDLGRLLAWDQNWVEDALADSYQQTLLLFGAQKAAGLRGHFHSYEVDHYFGLLCASYLR
jgi:aromatic ring-opening dioxygenase LigB subunit